MPTAIAPVPAALLLVSCSTPVLIVVPPLYVLAPVSTVVPAPICVTVPLPEITPGLLIVEPDAGSKASVPLSLTLPLIEPSVVPSPSCSVPALSVVPPE